MTVQIDLSGRMAMVTGGGSGIGRETSRLLARSGAAVGVADRDTAAAQGTVELITAAGGRAFALQVDVRDPAAAAAAVADTLAQLGRLDILVNNAAAWTIKLFIRCNAVSPGTTKTPGAQPVIDKWGGEEKLLAAYPIRRLGEPADQANAILFLCSDMSSWVTGQVLSVSGGYTMAD